jgi:hypothetical protein
MVTGDQPRLLDDQGSKLVIRRTPIPGLHHRTTDSCASWHGSKYMSLADGSRDNKTSEYFEGGRMLTALVTGFIVSVGINAFKKKGKS